MAKRPKRAAARPVTRDELRALRRDVAKALACADENTRQIADLRRQTEATVRRCGELQHAVDTIRKLLTNP